MVMRRVAAGAGVEGVTPVVLSMMERAPSVAGAGMEAVSGARVLRALKREDMLLELLLADLSCCLVGDRVVPFARFYARPDVATVSCSCRDWGGRPMRPDRASRLD